ncbi:hypothetical protein DSM02_3913 [Leeuwenhoekiella polynyae]|uniref:Uncharacterized protein n=1 Tax=Leeuwenhoekiella polynyae TaxID=1550906 RepID=A0A4Q0NQ75_9FLAO|nr:hypothetical protein DSM02_3913 [Leeuwenhoekiella polynyae]
MFKCNDNAFNDNHKPAWCFVGITAYLTTKYTLLWLIFSKIGGLFFTI